MDEHCIICSEVIESSGSAVVGDKGLNTLEQCSQAREDGLLERWQHMPQPLKVHVSCRKNYTRPTSIESHKRKLPDDSHQSPTKLRSTTPSFDIKGDCIYCGEVCIQSKYRSRESVTSEVETISYIDNVIKKADERGDQWGKEVKLRVQMSYDLVAAEGKYHRRCAQLFSLGCQLDDRDSSGHSGRPVDVGKNVAFLKLCEYLDNNDECQYSSTELMDIYRTYCGDAVGYTQKRLSQKLKEHYGDRMIVTAVPGMPSIFSFCDLGHKILREKWENISKASVSGDKSSIIEMAAAIIRDDIRSKVYDCSEYPDMSDLSDAKTVIPDSLDQLLHGILKTKADSCTSNERRCTAIAHSIISACRPRSFISPLLLAIAIYIHRRYASRELIDILSSMSFSDNYREVQRFNSAFLQNTEPNYDLQKFTQFIFDNADFNVATLTGHDTFHAMGGIACVTSPGKVAPATVALKRPTDIPNAESIGSFGQVDIQQYKKPSNSGLHSVIIGPLEPPTKPVPMNLNLAQSLNVLWQSSYSFGLELGQCPSWSGYMQIAMSQGGHDRSRIVILPFINQEPSKPSTIYTALSFVQKMSDKYGLGTCPVTFDQPLYIKAAEIVASSPDLTNICLRLGGFHMLMSYMGSIGFVMAGSGLESLWETVYAPNTVVHMSSGHAYARALRAHLLSSAAITCLLLDTPECLDGVDIDYLKQSHQEILDGDRSVSDVEHDGILQQMCQKLESVMDSISNESRTAKLWINYLKHVDVMKQFIWAERTGDWELHLYCVRKMIPLFHAGGHLAYAKSSRLYLQEMDELSTKMSPEEHQMFTNRGYFTIRRTDLFWSGNFSDQTIEQELMRLLKTSGGMTHGRGITDSSLVKWVHAMPFSIPVCDALEVFTSVHTINSEQHKDLRVSSAARDATDCTVFVQWLRDYSPFSYVESGSLVSISSGVVADATVNCDEAYNIGLATACRMEGKNFNKINLRRKDRVSTISATSNTLKVRGQDTVINPALLLMRITCIIKESSEMEQYLCYELAQQPPSLFDGGTMRKTGKDAMGNHLKSKVTAHTTVPDNAVFVIDGGHLLWTVPWPADATYDQVCGSYLEYVLRHFGQGSTVVFDGYDTQSTKTVERQQRAALGSAPCILFDRAMKTTTSQKLFLLNSKNKSRLIDCLAEDLQSHGITVKQHKGDADPLIVSTAISMAEETTRPVVVVGTDTDILVMLVSQTPPGANIHMMCNCNPVEVYDIESIQSASDSIMRHLLFVHAVTGCDTTSAFYKKGKVKALDIISSHEDRSILRVFTQPDSTHEDIQAAGESFILRLYGGFGVQSLNKLRHILYNRSLGKAAISSAFNIETLPPTSAAAKYHCYRTYHTVQQWLGNVLPAPDWGWKTTSDGSLAPIETDAPVAPDNILRMISCGCKTGCGRSCGCRKKGLNCSIMCSKCNGVTCSNTYVDVGAPDNYMQGF